MKAKILLYALPPLILAAFQLVEAQQANSLGRPQFEFVINQKTAKQIGLTIPPAVLARADKSLSDFGFG